MSSLGIHHFSAREKNEGGGMSDNSSQGDFSPIERYGGRNFKFDLAKESLRFGEFPPIRGCGKVPQCLLSITDFKKVCWPGAFVHTFKDDYKFDTRNGVWYETEKLVEVLLKKRMGMLSPDFSTFSDAHPEICKWNFFRSRLVGYQLECAGVEVIPTLMWWKGVKIDFVLQGLVPGGVYAVSTINAAKNRTECAEYGSHIREICAILKPRVLLVHGVADGIDWGGQVIQVYPNGSYDWTRSGKTA